MNEDLYITSTLDLVVWLGLNGIWPQRVVRSKVGKCACGATDRHHVHFEYPYKPVDLIDQYFQPGNKTRRALDILGRVRHHYVAAFREDATIKEVEFERPL